MKVIVDTSVWSLVLRRATQANPELAEALRNLVRDHRVQMVGPIRQELLSGIRHQAQFDRLRNRLDAFPDLPLSADDYVSAAGFFNVCRAQGIQGSNTDFLICAIASRHKLPIFTTDKDFDIFSKHIPIELYRAE